MRRYFTYIVLLCKPCEQVPNILIFTVLICENFTFQEAVKEGLKNAILENLKSETAK